MTGLTAEAEACSWAVLTASTAIVYHDPTFRGEVSFAGAFGATAHSRKLAVRVRKQGDMGD